MRRILVIDDDQAVRHVVGRVLERGGYEVEEAADGRAGMCVYRTSPFDLVITDINMPEMDGIEVIGELRGAGTPVVAISGGGRIDKNLLLDSAGLLGAVYTLAKPFTMEALLEVVRSALGEDAG